MYASIIIEVNELTQYRYPFVRDWSWTAQVFFTLHLLAIFMKMHSYA
jgi:hypothetical protein